jgi:hypothetical protein
LVIYGWVRGLLDRDIEAALAEVLGSEAALLKVTLFVDLPADPHRVQCPEAPSSSPRGR